jgi:exosome complex exonuclease DIS3/RRP44
VVVFHLFSCFAVSDYVRNVENSPGLEDRLSQYNTTYELQTAGQEPLFPLHATPSQIHEGIKSGKLLQGSFLASRENFLEGQVSVEGQDKMVSSYETVVINPSKDEVYLFYIRTRCVPRCKHSPLRL